MIITQALRDRASDVHIEPQDGQVRVRFRIDGALHDVIALPGEMASAVASRIKILAGMNIVERRRPQDGKIAMTVDDRHIDIRVSTTGVIWGEKVVLRVLDKTRPLYKLRDLGMPPATNAAYSKMIRSPYGMVICAGPTGSGKTTTLYASMTEVNGPTRTSRPSRTRSSTSSRRSTRSRSTRRPASRSPAGCGRSCAKTPT